MLVFAFCMNYFNMKNNLRGEEYFINLATLPLYTFFTILLPIKNDYIKNMLFSEPYLQSFKYH